MDKVKVSIKDVAFAFVVALWLAIMVLTVLCAYRAGSFFPAKAYGTIAAQEQLENGKWAITYRFTLDGQEHTADATAPKPRDLNGTYRLWFNKATPSRVVDGAILINDVLTVGVGCFAITFAGLIVWDLILVNKYTERTRLSE